MKVAVGLSGGVDSTVAAALLKERGADVVGVTMTLGRADEAKALDETRRVAHALGIPLHVFDLAEAWQANVVNDLRDTFLRGETPNPCVRCNESVKFGLLPRLAFDLGCERFATGHYARLHPTPDGSIRLLRAADRAKDQSYFLYRVDRDILARTLFPLGDLTKDEVRERARALSLVVADKGDSQDFCGGDTHEIVGAEPREGEIVDTAGRVLGHHPGFWNYTVGKRKGLGIGGGTPFFVIALDAARNRVIVGPREALVVRRFSIHGIVRFDVAMAGVPLAVKVRSAGEPKGPVIWCGDENVECPEGLSGLAPGQSAVFFANDTIVGGGIISSRKETP